MLYIDICVFFVMVSRTAYFICLQVGDRSGELTARLNLSDLQMVLGLSYSTNNSMLSESHVVENSLNGTCVPVPAILSNISSSFSGQLTLSVTGYGLVSPRDVSNRSFPPPFF